MKTETVSFVALVLFSLFLPSLIPSASASTSLKNSEKITSLNSINDEILGSAASDDNNDSVAIVTGEYCEFLNAVAADDLHHLYNEKLREDAAAACIQRSGAPGHYTYVVAAEKEGESVFYVDRLSAMRYCNWFQNGSGSIDEDPSITEHGVYEIQNNQLVAINPAANYFVADDNGPLSLPSCYDQQLRSSRSGFHVVHASSIYSNKISKPGDGKTPWKTVEGDAVDLAVVLGGGGEGAEVTERTRRRETRESLPPALNANFANSAGIIPRQMMNPSTAEEGAEALEQIFRNGKTRLTDKTLSIRADRDDISKFTNEKPRLLGGVPKPIAGIKSPEKEKDDVLPMSIDEAIAIEKQFKDAITAYPDAPRLIVKEGEIVPPDLNVVSNNNDSENQDIMRMLKNVITARYSLDVANSIPELNQLAFVAARDVSAAKISEIFDKLDTSKTVSQHFNLIDLVPRLKGGMMNGGGAGANPILSPIPEPPGAALIAQATAALQDAKNALDGSFSHAKWGNYYHNSYKQAVQHTTTVGDAWKKRLNILNTHKTETAPPYAEADSTLAINETQAEVCSWDKKRSQAQHNMNEVLLPEVADVKKAFFAQLAPARAHWHNFVIAKNNAEQKINRAWLARWRINIFPPNPGYRSLAIKRYSKSKLQAIIAVNRAIIALQQFNKQPLNFNFPFAHQHGYLPWAIIYSNQAIMGVNTIEVVLPKAAAPAGGWQNISHIAADAHNSANLALTQLQKSPDTIWTSEVTWIVTIARHAANFADLVVKQRNLPWAGHL